MTTLTLQDLSKVETLDRQIMKNVHGGIIGACAPGPQAEAGMTVNDYVLGLSQYLGNIGRQNGLNCDGSAGPRP
jgi:hypothetical protein